MMVLLVFVILLSFHPSTVSSSINALAAVTLEDLIKPYTNMSEKHLFWMSKGLSKWMSLSAGQPVHQGNDLPEEPH